MLDLVGKNFLPIRSAQVLDDGTLQRRHAVPANRVLQVAEVIDHVLGFLQPQCELSLHPLDGRHDFVALQLRDDLVSPCVDSAHLVQSSHAAEQHGVLGGEGGTHSLGVEALASHEVCDDQGLCGGLIHVAFSFVLRVDDDGGDFLRDVLHLLADSEHVVDGIGRGLQECIAIFFRTMLAAVLSASNVLLDHGIGQLQRQIRKVRAEDQRHVRVGKMVCHDRLSVALKPLYVCLMIHQWDITICYMLHLLHPGRLRRPTRL